MSQMAKDSNHLRKHNTKRDINSSDQSSVSFPFLFPFFHLSREGSREKGVSKEDRDMKFESDLNITIYLRNSCRKPKYCSHYILPAVKGHKKDGQPLLIHSHKRGGSTE